MPFFSVPITVHPRIGPFTMQQGEYPYNPPFYAPATRSRPRWVKGPSPFIAAINFVYSVVPHSSSQNRTSIVNFKCLFVLSSPSLEMFLAKGPRVVPYTVFLRVNPSTQAQTTESAMGMYIRNFLGPLIN